MNTQRIKESLLQGCNIPRIIGREHMMCSSVLIPLIIQKESIQILFQKRAAHIRQGGEICFPGGRFDKDRDRDFKVTAVRETCEEIGISAEKIEILGSPGTLITPMNILIQPYLGILKIDSLEDLIPNKDEVEKLFTIPLEWFENHRPKEYLLPVKAHPFTIDKRTGKLEYHFPIKDLKLPPRYQEPWEGGSRHRIWTFDTSNGILWGITAQILVEILPLLLKNKY